LSSSRLRVHVVARSEATARRGEWSPGGAHAGVTVCRGRQHYRIKIRGKIRVQGAVRSMHKGGRCGAEKGERANAMSPFSSECPLSFRTVLHSRKRVSRKENVFQPP